MNRRLTPFYMVVFILSSSFAQAAPSCFAGKDPFFSPLMALSSPQDVANGLEKTCGELGRADMHTKGNIAFRTFQKITNFVGLGIIFGTGLGSFSNMDSTPEEIAYVEKLKAIKQIENPMERIRQVYNLAASTQGFYDEVTMGMRTWKNGKLVLAMTPDNLLDSRKKYGTAGVCRELASLLQWSLLQVARHPTSQTAGLTNKDFSSEVVVGFPAGMGHAWLRVHLPVHSESGQILGFQDFELDTTWYPQVFSILYPRESGMKNPERWELLNQCQQIRSCLENSSK